MKRFVVLSCAVFTLASCAGFFSNQGPSFTFTVTSPSQDDLVLVSVPSLEVVNRVSTGKGVAGLDIRVQNNSDKSLVVKWGDSSIEYNNKSHVVFLTDRSYSDAGRPMPDSYIPAGRKVTSGVIPAENVPSASAYAQMGAGFDLIKSKDITCHVAIDLGGESRVYVVHVLVGEYAQQ